MLSKLFLSKRPVIFLILILMVFSFIPAYAKELMPNFPLKFSLGVFEEKKQISEDSSFAEVAKLMASDGEVDDQFGEVAISGNTVAVGANRENTGGFEAGAVYIYERNEDGSDTWGQVKKILPSDLGSGDRFGTFIDMNEDILVVSSYLANPNGVDSGATYIFERNAGGINNWGQIKKLLPSDGNATDRFGWGVSISGNVVAIGAYQNDDNGSSSGSVYIFERDMGGVNNWGQVKKITASDASAEDRFGQGIAVSGDTIVVGASENDDNGPSSGSAYIFERNQGGLNNWGEVRKITASDAAADDQFGHWVDISGNTIVIGAHNNDDQGTDSGSAYVFQRDLGGSNNWGEVTKLLPSDGNAGDIFSYRAVAIDGDMIVVGSRYHDSSGSNAGSTYVFERNSGGENQWGEISKLIASDGTAGDELGGRVGVSGNIIVSGAQFHNNKGTAYVFYPNTSIIATDDSGPEFTTDEATPFTTGNVLVNDTSSNPISVLGFDATNTLGSVTNNGDGTFAYDPNGQFESLSEGQQAFDTFEYTIADTTGLTDTAMVTITVLGLNDASIIEPANLLLTPNPVNENGSVLLTSSFTDPDTNDAHTATIAWGDGSTDIVELSTGVLNFELSHTYLDDNPSRTASDLYPVNVTISDGFTADNATTSITVKNIVPILANLAVSMDANGLATLTGTITDPGTLDIFSLKVIWGDGIWTRFSFPAGTTTFTVTHLYTLQPGLTPSSLYTIKLNLNDDDSGRAKGQINLSFNPIITTDSFDK